MKTHEKPKQDTSETLELASDPSKPISLKIFLEKKFFLEMLLSSALWGAIISLFVTFILGGGLNNPARLLKQWKPIWTTLIWVIPVVGLIWALVLSSAGFLYRYALIPKLDQWKSKVPPVLSISVTGFLTGFVSLMIILNTLYYLLNIQIFNSGGFMKESGIAGLIAIGVGQILYSHYLKEVNLWQTWLREQELAKHKLAGELMNLNMRIRPHFFFNAINTLASFIDQDRSKAQELLADLADLFRQSFQHGQNTPWCSWQEEKKLTESFIHIEQSRFGDRLQVCWHDQLNPAVRFPAFILQPLVENAIKYGLRTQLEKVVVHIITKQDEKKWIIEVINPAPTDSKIELKEGHSLYSISKRMHLLNGSLNYHLDKGKAVLSLTGSLP
ncbi:MAG: hypothetical protein CSA81_06065 [Acidobacteria bacterium]|nr:MAG: hypothetical protein CSA81_06065 [Acidobacteriota bacterium]PIE89620.1 MAG: hypothetical protein CR997_10425 [Acidobacteriota bacterium]